MSAFLPRSLRGRIFLLIALAFLPAVLILAYSYAQVRSLTAERQEQEVLRMAEVVAADYQRLVDETGSLLRGLARVDEIREGRNPACDRLLTSVLEANPRYTSLAVIDPDGYRLCGALEAEAPLFLGDRSYVIRATGTSSFAVGNYQVGRITGRSTVGFAYPLTDTEGARRGILAAALDLEQLSEYAPAAQLGAETTLTLTDREGTVLLRLPDDVSWIGEAVPEDFPLGLDEAEQATLVRGTDLDGAARTFAVRALEGEGESPEGYLALGVDPEAVGEVEAIFGLTFLLLALGAGAVVVLAWLLGHYSVIRPVAAIVSAEDALKKGDLEARVRLEGGPEELRRIARAFDEMAERVQERERPEAGETARGRGSDG